MIGAAHLSLSRSSSRGRVLSSVKRFSIVPLKNQGGAGYLVAGAGRGTLTAGAPLDQPATSHGLFELPVYGFNVTRS